MLILKVLIIIALKTSPRCAPSVLIMFINMMLFKHTKPFDGCDEYMFEGQVSNFNLNFNHILFILDTFYILGSFTKDFCYDRYAMYPSNVVRQTIVHNSIRETPQEPYGL